MSCTCSRGDEKDQLTVVYNKLDRIDTIDRITEANSAIWKQLRKIIIPVVSVWVLQGFVERCLWYVAQTLEKTLNLIVQQTLLVKRKQCFTTRRFKWTRCPRVRSRTWTGTFPSPARSKTVWASSGWALLGVGYLLFCTVLATWRPLLHQIDFLLPK